MLNHEFYSYSPNPDHVKLRGEADVNTVADALERYGGDEDREMHRALRGIQAYSLLGRLPETQSKTRPTLSIAASDARATVIGSLLKAVSDQKSSGAEKGRVVVLLSKLITINI